MTKMWADGICCVALIVMACLLIAPGSSNHPIVFAMILALLGVLLIYTGDDPDRC